MTGWEPVGGTVWKAAVPNALFGAFNPFAEEIDGDWIVYPDEDVAAQAPRRRVPQRAELLRGAEPRARCRIRRCGPRCSTTGPGRPTAIRDPEQTRLRLVRRGRRRRRRRSGRTSRAPTRTSELVEINVRRSVFYPTEHHVDYITVRGFELAQAASPVGAADRRPARPHRPELGQGLDHRGQRHPRREVLGRLHRQGGLDRPQLRDPARRQARLPVPARVGVLRPPDRLGPGAHRLAHHPPQHHLRLRPERHRRPPRLRVLHDRGQPHLQHRAQARVLRLRDRRHQAARGHRRRHPPQPHPRLLARHLAGLADPGHPRLAQPLLRQHTATSSSR